MIRRIAAYACAALLGAILAVVPAAAQFADQATFATANGGTGTALTATIPNATSIADLKGVIIKIVPSTGNTGDTTLTVNGFGSPPHIYKPSPSGPVLLTGGELVALQPAWLMLDASGNFNLLSVTSTSFGAASITNSALSFGVPVNLQINASVGSNNLTIAVKGNNGSDPSATNPVLIPFRDSTIANGGPKIVSLQSALSFTINSGNSMGCISAVMCRLWIVPICSTGLECTGSAGSDVVALCAFNANSGGTSIAPINEAALQTSASGTNGGSSAQTYYCNASAVTARAIRIIGYVDIQEASAGTWATGPTKVQLFGPGIKKPGDIIQGPLYFVNSQATVSSGSTPTATNLTKSITPSSAANLILVQAQGTLDGLSAQVGNSQIYRGTSTAIGNQPAVKSNNSFSVGMTALDQPNVTTSTAYTVYVWGVSNATWDLATVPCVMMIYEIMGALEPANDNEPLRAVG